MAAKRSGLTQALGALMISFAGWQEELLATQSTTEQLLQEIADGKLAADDRTLQRLDRLSASCAKLAYGNNSPDKLSESLHNLVAWCDHLDDPDTRASFTLALRTFPLRSPLART